MLQNYHSKEAGKQGKGKRARDENGDAAAGPATKKPRGELAKEQDKDKSKDKEKGNDQGKRTGKSQTNETRTGKAKEGAKEKGKGKPQGSASEEGERSSSARIAYDHDPCTASGSDGAPTIKCRKKDCGSLAHPTCLPRTTKKTLRKTWECKDH
jgi:hypothetical protein